MRREDFSLAAMSGRIGEGKLSSRGAVDFFLDRIARLDSTIQAWTTLDTAGAIERAEERDRELQAGRNRGRLHGVPVGIKDIFMTRGIRTTMGSPIFQDHVPDRDAEAVRRLSRAGAVVLGKTVTAQFAALDPGTTRNPWNTAHTPGGSSSGSAAAVAAGMCAGATGTQTAGSIGRPAAFCGIVGLMPTASRIPRDGIFPSAWSLDHVGAFGHTVEDVSLLYSAMAAVSPNSESPIPFGDVRVGVIRDYFETITDSEAWQIHLRLIDRLKAARVPLREIEPPELFGAAAGTLRTIMRVEIAAAHEQLHRDHAARYGVNLRGMIETGLLVSGSDYLAALRLRRRYQREMRRIFDDCDVILTPGARGPAPSGLESTGDPAASIPWTLADCPTLSLPVALTASRMPIGVQISAAPHEEERLLSIGADFERFVEFEDLPQPDGVGS